MTRAERRCRLDDAMSRWEAAAAAEALQARASRYAIHCGDPLALVSTIMSRTALTTRLVLQRMGFGPPPPVPEDMLAMLHKLDREERP